MKHLFNIAVVAACAIFFSACNQESLTAVEDRKEILIGSWKVRKAFVDDEEMTTDLPDWKMDFKPDGTYEGSVDDRRVVGTWGFNYDPTLIKLDEGTTDEWIWNVTELSLLILKVNYTFAGVKFAYYWIPE